MKSPVPPPKKPLLEESDPYEGSSRYTIPMPIAAEVNSDTVWQDFNEVGAQLDAQFAKTDFIELKDRDSQK
jgi:hypothetical protein